MFSPFNPPLPSSKAHHHPVQNHRHSHGDGPNNLIITNINQNAWNAKRYFSTDEYTRGGGSDATAASENNHWASRCKYSETFTKIVDVTIAYPDGGVPLGIFDILSGWRPPCTTHVHYRIFDVNQVLHTVSVRTEDPFISKHPHRHAGVRHRIPL